MPLRHQKRSRDACRLAIELLEPRTVLSAATLAALADLAALPPSDGPHAGFEMPTFIQPGPADRRATPGELARAYDIGRPIGPERGPAEDRPDWRMATVSAFGPRDLSGDWLDSTPPAPHQGTPFDKVPFDGASDSVWQPVAAFGRPTHDGLRSEQPETPPPPLFAGSQDRPPDPAVRPGDATDSLLPPGFAYSHAPTLAVPPASASTALSVSALPERSSFSDHRSQTPPPSPLDRPREPLAIVIESLSPSPVRDLVARFVVPDSTRQGLGIPAPSQSFAMRATQEATRPNLPPLEVSRDSTTPPLQVAFNAGQIDIDRLLRDLSAAVFAAGSTLDGGAVALPGREAEWYAYPNARSATPASVVDASPFPSFVEHRRHVTGDDPSMDAADWHEDADGTSLLDGIRAGRRGRTEGGLVDITTAGEGLLAGNSPVRSHTHAARTAASDAVGDGCSIESFRRETRRSSPLVEREDSGAGSQRIASADEGGMIELAATDSAASVSSTVRDRRVWPAGTRTIQMDVGVGLFQAFELATAPAEQTDPAPAAAADGSLAEPTPRGSVSAVGGGTPTADADAPPEHPAQRAAVVPALAGITLLLADVRRRRHLGNSHSAADVPTQPPHAVAGLPIDPAGDFGEQLDLTDRAGL